MAEPVPTYVFWLEHVKALIHQETRVILERIDGIEEARRLQSAELARRLEELNHAHAQSLDDRIEFVRRDTYEAFHDSVVATLAQHRGRDTVVIAIISIFSTVFVGYLIHSVFGIGTR